MIPFLLLLVNFSQKQIADGHVIIDAATSRYASEYILVTTPFGIYTFERNAQTWKSITTTHGLPDDQARVLGFDQGIMWVATDKGLASADIRLNDWQTYTLPSPVTGLTFDDYYVWVAGEFGLKRFDKYAETWEDITDAPANDILYDKTYIWLATEQGISRYNPEFEKLEPMYAAPQHDYYYIIETRSKLWFLALDGIASYHRITESWSLYPVLAVEDYSSIGDSLLVLSNGRVYLYDPSTDSWGPFIDIDGYGPINGLSTSPKVSNSISLATDQGLILYDWVEKTRKDYDRANGMYYDTITDVYEANDFIFAIGRDIIQYLDKESGIWQIVKLMPARPASQQLLYHDQAGLHASVVPDVDARLEGRAYYSLSGTRTDSTEWWDYSTINLRLIGQHKSDRTLSLYYNDTDKEDTLYGFGYRGLESDLLHRSNGGFIESEYYEFNLVPSFLTLGANARLRHSAQSLTLQAGQLKSSYHDDFFYGRSFEKQDSVYDVDYSRHTFYRIPGAALDPLGSDTIFIDDRLSETNSIDTRISSTFAGIIGDFEPLINGLHYFIDYEKSIIQLISPVNDSDIIVLMTGGQAIVIQSDSVQSNMLQNIYSLGPDITPGSLELQIQDTLGTIHPLADFGIDNDQDGSVDPEFVDYRLGFLIFPQVRPFPDEVYEQNLHIYVIRYLFATQSVFYRLSQQPVLIGSEKVFVDGEQMTREFHYIIEYSSGTILFLTEETVTDFSEVEVQYMAVERARTDVFYAVQPNIKIGDDLNVAPGLTLMDEEEILHLSGKYQVGSEKKSLMFVPQLAVNSEREYAQDYLVVANYGRFTLNTNYRGYSDEFESFGLKSTRYGQLRQSGSIALGFDPVDYVRLNTTLKTETSLDSSNVANATQYLSGRVDYLNPHLPNGFALIARNDLPDHNKLKLQTKLNYQFEVSKNRVRLNLVAHHDILDFDAGNRKKTFEYSFGTNIAMSFPLRADIYLHGIDLLHNDIQEKDESEMRLALNFDFIPGLYYTGNYQQKRVTYYLPVSKDLSVRHYFYNNLNIAPGRWYMPLSIVNLSLGAGTNFEEYLDDLTRTYEPPIIMLCPLEDSIATLTDLRNVYAKLYLVPFSNLNIQLKRSVNRSGSAHFCMPQLRVNYADELRVEYEHMRIGMLTATYNRTKNMLYPIQLIENSYLEWTKPWTAMLRTKLIGNHRTDQYDYTIAHTRDTETNIRLETLLRFGERSYVNVSLAGRRQDRYTSGVSHSILPGCSIYLNLFEFLFMQFDYEANVVIDSSTTHLLSAKITGSF